jgi:hypothetical protein
MDNIRAAMLIDRGMSQLEEEVRAKAVRAVVRMCPDHELILYALGLADVPAPEPPPEEVPTCKRGHPRTAENLRRTSRGMRCRPCERICDAERRKANPRPKKVREPRPTNRSTPYDIKRNIAINEARKVVGLSWGDYRKTYGGGLVTALAVVAAAGDQEALEALKKDGR